MSKLSNFLTESTKSTFKLGGAQTMKICVPINSSYSYGNNDDKIEMEEIPLSVGLSQQFSFPSPFGNTPGIVEVFIKVDDSNWVKYAPQYISTSDSRGVVAVCLGDGQIHVSTGTTFVAVPAMQSYGVCAPIYALSALKAAEVAFVVWVASSKTPDDYQAEETVIGTYFGKTLYRYCIKDIRITTTTTTINLPFTVSSLVSLRGGSLRLNDNKFFPIPTAHNTNYVSMAVYNKSDGNCVLDIAPNGTLCNGVCSVIIEYTKD